MDTLRELHGRLCAVVGALAIFSGPVDAQTLFEEVTTLSNAATTVERSFSIPAAGSYQLNLTDFGQPANFSSLRLIVTRGLQTVATVDSLGSHTFSATAGTHEIHVIGTPGVGSSAGIFGVEVLPSGGGTAVFQFADTIAVPPLPNPNLATLDAEFTVTDAGTYDVVLADMAFPATLQSVQFNILGPGGLAFPAPGPSAPGTYTFTASPGIHTLLVVAEASAAASAGLYSVHISGGPSTAVVYQRAHPVAQVDAAVLIDLPAAGSHTLRLTDFNAPAALARLAAILVRGVTQLSRRDSPGTESFNAAGGAAELFLLTTPAAVTGSGTYGVDITSGAATGYSAARTVNVAGASMPGFTFAADVPTALGYRLTLTDFDFPTPFDSVTAHVLQGGASLGTIAADADLDVDPAVGRIFVTVITDPRSGTSNSLFALQLGPAGGAPLIDVTQGVGGLFDVRTVDVAQSGSYDATLADLGFPSIFTNLAVAVTRGSNRVGSIFGGGSFSFSATPGRYYLNFLAEPAAQARAGTYGLSVSPTPPAPTVTLTAGTASVANGGTTTLTWSSTGATSCTASGAWSGNKATSGTETTAALTSSSTFTLTCTGPGGNANQSTTVSISAPAPGGGGGGGSLGLITLLVTLASVMRRSNPYTRSPRTASTSLPL